ncbi:MAG: sigma-70 family RNA polymerase sigma factor [Firmicutes bacterium]|nr:sigma-70 family RNA polymerase sigma factor [Bacillota bacterium]
MNVYEQIYLYFLKDEQAFIELYNYLYPMIMTLMSRRMADMYHMKEEMLEIAQQVLFECLENSRVDQYWRFVSFYRTSLQNRWNDFYHFEMRHDVSMKYESISLDMEIREDSNTFHYEFVSSGESIHHQVMVQLEQERLDQLAQREFSYLDLNILSLKRMGMTAIEIAQTLGMEASRVRYILSKLKKWYAMH